MIEELSQLAQYGLSGICIALVILIGFLFNKVSTMMSNHIQHNTDAWNKNTEALTKLTSKMDEDISAQKETAGTLRELQNIIKNK